MPGARQAWYSQRRLHIVLFQTPGKLQLIQNAAACLFGGLRKYDHVTSTNKSELHWLRILERISFNLNALVYKALHGEGPAYLKEL